MSSQSLKTPFNLYLRLIQMKDLSFMWNSIFIYRLQINKLWIVGWFWLSLISWKISKYSILFKLLNSISQLIWYACQVCILKKCTVALYSVFAYYKWYILSRDLILRTSLFCLKRKVGSEELCEIGSPVWEYRPSVGSTPPDGKQMQEMFQHL